jgi:uncharacterized delta-60 repeat protein
MRSFREGALRTTVLAAASTLMLGIAGAAVGAPRHPGALDPSFHGTGRVAIQAGDPESEANGVARQGTKTIVVGRIRGEASSDVSVIRLMPDGRLDRTFGRGDGIYTKDVFGDADIAHAVRVLPDGKILLVGSAYQMSAGAYRILVIRLTADGRPDRRFGGGDGIVTAGLPGLSNEAFAMTVRPDGKFVVCGSAYDDGSGDSAFELARFKPGGAPDAGFGTGGFVEAPIPGYTSAACRGVAGTGTGTVAVGFASNGGPSVIAAARLGPGGGPDPTFSQDGFATFSPQNNSLGAGVVDLPHGKVVIAGWGYEGADPPDVDLLQLTSHGRRDPAFGGGDGLVVDDLGSADEATALIRLPDGDLAVAGFRNPDMFVARYRSGGGRDRTFGQLGVQAKPWAGPSIASSLVLMRGKLVIAGSTQVGGHDRSAVERVFG